MENRPSGAEMGVQTAEKKSPRKRKIPKFFHRIKKVAVEESPTETPHFASARELHHARGYHEHTIKEIMKRPKRKRAPEEKPLEKVVEPVVEKPVEQPKPFMELQIHPEGIDYVKPEGEPRIPTVEEIMLLDQHNKPTRHERAKDALHKTGEFLGKTAENIKWGLGRFTRGDIVKRLQHMHQNPQEYSAELQTELQRSIVNVLTPEDASFVGRHRKDFTQGLITASTVIPFWIPLGHFLFYTLGSVEVTGVNIYNTAKAVQEKRFRKAGAYALMTLGGMATGFFPGAHNLTNTWYTELLQKSFDDAESDGMLTITKSLFDPTTSKEKRALGYTMVNQAVSDAFDQTGSLLFQPQQLEEAQTRWETKYADLVRQQDDIREQREAMPRILDVLRHPSTIAGNITTYAQLLGKSINLNQEFTDVAHRLHTIPQLASIFTGAREYHHGQLLQ